MKPGGRGLPSAAVIRPTFPSSISMMGVVSILKMTGQRPACQPGASVSACTPFSPLVAMILEGPNAINAARQVIGATDPLEADAGSIRGELATDVTFNLVHGSDSPESAETEIALYFSPEELLNYETAAHDWTFKPGEV